MKKKAIIKAYRRQKKEKKAAIIKKVKNPKTFQDDFVSRIAVWMHQQNPEAPETVKLQREPLQDIFEEIFLENMKRNLTEDEWRIANKIIDDTIKKVESE